MTDRGKRITEQRKKIRQLTLKGVDRYVEKQIDSWGDR